ncbi:MAG: GTPase HflX [Alphaproteobacteria bacterium]|nr:GTPase HflX [Alphaproteobacteria bacterium]
MIEVQQNPQTNACVICPLISGENLSLSAESRLQEACDLALAINLNVVYSELVRLKNIKPATFFSHGFTDKILPIIAAEQIELLIVDTHLTPIQQRNLERELKVKVIDRTALILEIFGERANTKEGVLQVELAHLTYQRSRLVRSWTHLERQRGGAGFLGGPGETQIELDRRVIDDKIIKIKKALEKVKKTRDIQRGARRKIPYPTVALVGYTNAGKSTLFNRLTSSNVIAADMLFATLDPTMRKIKLPNDMEVILSDTVGFISDLPHELVMAFRATLEEVLNADIILHIRDIANADTSIQKADVLNVLENLGLKEIKHSSAYIEVLNKADLLSAEEHINWHHKANNTDKVLISAYSGEGCDTLLQVIADKLSHNYMLYRVQFPHSEGKLAAWLYKNSTVIKAENTEQCNVYLIKISAENLSRLQSMVSALPDISIAVEKY